MRVLSGSPERAGILFASGGAAWESRAVEAVAAAGPGLVLLRRCLDLTELLAAASTGSARLAVVSHHLPGLDADAVLQLTRQGVRVLAVCDGREAERSRLERIGVSAVVAGVEEDFAARLRALAQQAEPAPLLGGVEARDTEGPLLGPPSGRVVAVWGAHGAPGRTTVAVGLAAELARRGQATFLLDADPYGGAVAQHLGITDEVSGLLAAARTANTGLLDSRRLAGLARRLGPRLRVLTGLPRPDRWRELRVAAMGEVVTCAAALDPVVVVDAGPGLDAADEVAPSRDALVTSVVADADVVVAVAAADPVGLARAARALVDLEEVRPGGAAYVVVNRWRAGLGWSRDEVLDLLHRLAPSAKVVVVPEDRGGADRALVSGRAPAEGRDSPLGRALAVLAEQVGGAAEQSSRRRLRGLLRR